MKWIFFLLIFFNSILSFCFCSGKFFHKKPGRFAATGVLMCRWLAYKKLSSVRLCFPPSTFPFASMFLHIGAYHIAVENVDSCTLSPKLRRVVRQNFVCWNGDLIFCFCEKCFKKIPTWAILFCKIKNPAFFAGPVLYWMSLYLFLSTTCPAPDMASFRTKPHCSFNICLEK